ncbi:MAG: phosphohistidine phosphatase SixA [Polyangiaceae bacterium]|nr:phosphohistidine phosphatase SixA [Polyangiaceae bacterium]
MRIYVMRHGPAEDAALSGRDADRALTPSGRNRVKNVAQELTRRSETPRLILSSPLVRALQTAEIVTALTEPEQGIRIHPDLCPGRDSSRLARELLSQGARRVMLVGHEPDLSALVATLVPGLALTSFEKAMVVGLRLSEGAEPERRFVLSPKDLAWS